MTVSGGQKRDSAIYIHTYPFSPKLPSHPGCHITLSRVPCVHSMSLLVIHFKYSSVCMSIPNSLTTSSPYPKGILSYCLNISLKRVSQPPDLIQAPHPHPFFHKHNSSHLLLLSTKKQVSPPSGWSQADPTALWSCRGLFGRI